ncbi:MAG: Ig-like domain-containing protein [Dehalococcoidia bacterium]
MRDGREGLRRLLRAPGRRIFAAALALTTVAVIAALAVTLTLVLRDDGPPAEPVFVRSEAPAAGWQTVDVSAGDTTYRMRATKSGDAGIAADSLFVVESEAGDLDPEQLPALLRVEPEFSFTAQGDADKITISPSAALREETSYRFALLDPADRHVLRSWSFQTEAPLRVVQTLPAERAVNVPLDTGIELTFSHDGVQDIADQLTIDPPVDGRIEYQKRVAVFIPRRLAPETLYTVTLAPGVRVAGSDLGTEEPFTFRFETGSVTRQDQLPFSPQMVAFARLVYESSTAEPPVLQLAAYGAAQDLSLSFEVYRYDGAQDFIDAIGETAEVPAWSFFGRRDFRLDPSGLDRAATFTVDAVQPSEQDPYEQYAVFPDQLDPGFYLVQAAWRQQGQEEQFQALLQVTDLAAYAALSGPKTVVWVNDLTTRAPVEDAQVSDGHGHAFDTGADGIAMFDTPAPLLPPDPADDDDTTVRALRVEHDGRETVVPLQSTAAIGIYGYGYDYRYYGGDANYYSGVSDDYWSYLYTDRRLYRKTDEINVWGVARKREGFQPGEELTLRLTGGDYYDMRYRPSVLAETTVRVSDVGTFEGKLAFEGASAGGYTVEIVAGDTPITQSYVQVQDFVKPAYDITLEPSRRVAIAGDNVNFDITSEFFDGSPVPFIDLTFERPDGAGPQPLRTDADGHASAGYVAVAAGPLDGPYSRSAYVYPTGPEQGEIYRYTQLYVLPAALTLVAGGEVESGTATVSGTVHNADLSAFDDDESDAYFYSYDDINGTPAPGRPVALHVVEISYNKVEVGEHYDFIAKVVRKEYRYDAVESVLGDFSAVSAADGTFSTRFPAAKDKTYRVEVTVQDGAGRTGGTRVYLSGDAIPYTNYSGDRYLHLAEAHPDITSGGYAQPRQWSIGDTVALAVTRGGEPPETDRDARYLFLRARDGLRDYTVRTEPAFEFGFSDAHVPNIIVRAVQFNGRGYDETENYSASLKASDRQLNISVTPDRERYEPGDDVTLTVETRGPDGQPVAAEALLSAVDEAIFALEGGNSYGQDILGSLYGQLSSGILQTYVPSYITSEQIAPAPNAVGGPDTGPGGAGIGIPGPSTGGSLADPRTDFRDLALFRAVRTDDSGRTTVTFPLSDNVTSWRITSRAVTGDLAAGAATASLPVGLPFFVEVTAADEYLAADRPVISLRAFGRALDSGDPVEYRVIAPSLGLNAPAVVRGEAFRGAEFALPPLTQGEHEITVEARSGDTSDAIVRTLRVVTSRLRRGEARYAELAAGVTLEGAAAGRTRVVFSDHNRGRFYGDLLQLGWTWGDRIDQMLARDLAQELLRTYFEAEPPYDAPPFDAALYQTEQGGIALFPYAGDDLTLSARALAVAPDRFGRNALAQYFRAVLDDPDETRERSIIALYGLAAAGEPVASSLDALAAEDDLSVRERLYLGLAALSAGDEDLAREQYRRVMVEHGEQRDPFVRVRTGSDQDDILEATALAADLAAGLGDDLAPGLFKYTRANATEDILVELEQISFLSRALPRLPSAPARVSYVLDGRREERDLPPGNSFTLSVTPEQLAQLDPRTLEGYAGIATFFEAPFDPATVDVDPDASVTRIVDVDGGGIREGDLVLVRLDYALSPQSLDGCYQITDLLPSGLRAVTRPVRPNEGADIVYPYRVDGQRVSFCVYRTGEYRAPQYYARVVTKGTYEAEPAIIQSQQSAQSFNFAPATTVEVR